MLKIQFKVKGQSEQGQQIRIVGSLPKLGDWNPNEALKLERTSYSDWESFQPVEIGENVKFEFKLIKYRGPNDFEWEKLPNNSNRKFKPKFNSKLIITWSLAQGKVVKESRRSYKIKGLPGAIINDGKPEKKSSVFDPYKKATQSDSDKQDEDNFGFLQKRQILDPRQKMNTGDIEEMYYDTTEVEIAVGQPKKNKIYLFSKQIDFACPFFSKIQQEAEQADNTYYKWIFCSSKQQLPKMKRIQFLMIPENLITPNMSIQSQFEQFSDPNALYIFFDLYWTLKLDVQSLKACLFLKGDQYEEVQQKIEFLQKFKFIVFDNPDKNQQFFQFLRARKNHQQIQESDSQQAVSVVLDKKQLSKVSLAGVVEELKLSEFSKSVKVNTVYNISESEALEQLQQDNSVLILDCHLKEENDSFFNRLIGAEAKNRMIIIIAPDKCPEPIKEYIPRRDIVIISGNYEKIRLKQKVHEPMRKHIEIIDTLKLKAKLSQEIYGGQIVINHSSIIYRNLEKPAVLKKIEAEVKTILKDKNYFKINLKNNRIKIVWYLAPLIRVIRTLCRIKFLSQGKIGNFFLISCQQNFEDMKNQIKLMVQLRSCFLENGTSTKVDHFSYGNKVPAKYTIIPDLPKVQQAEATDAKAE